MTNDERVLVGLYRMAEAEVIDGIEHIRLAGSVVSDQTIDLRRELQCRLAYILIIDERKLL